MYVTVIHIIKSAIKRTQPELIPQTNIFATVHHGGCNQRLEAVIYSLIFVCNSKGTRMLAVNVSGRPSLSTRESALLTPVTRSPSIMFLHCDLDQ